MSYQQLVEQKCCLRCLGRTFDQSHASELNSSISLAKQQLTPEILDQVVEEEDCQFCLGSVKAVIELTDRLLDKLEQLEFSTFLVGCQLTDQLEQADQKLAAYGLGLDLKSEIRREVGLRVQNQFDREVDYELPDLNILIDTNRFRYQLDIRSVYILGRYQKLTRGLPQTKWPCGKCRGRGCESCNQTGQQYPKTVETVISPPFLKAFESRESSFHGAGREDIDALMLGEGRPFVLELKSPAKRNLDLPPIVEQVNQQKDVQITDMRYTDKSMIAFLKQGSPNATKSYQATVKVETEITDNMIDLINQHGNHPIDLDQRTPQRVSHRRADKVRKKTIYQVSAVRLDMQLMQLDIDAQGGAYIKEFISGDDGRTIPSISSIIGVPCVCTALDVTAVDDRGVFSS